MVSITKNPDLWVGTGTLDMMMAGEEPEISAKEGEILKGLIYFDKHSANYDKMQVY